MPDSERTIYEYTKYLRNMRHLSKVQVENL